MTGQVAIVGAVLALIVVVGLIALIRTRRVVTTPTERAVHSTLHTASLAARSLRTGLSEESAREALPHLRTLTAAEAVALFDDEPRELAHEPAGDDLWDPALLNAAANAASSARGDQRRVLVTDPCGADSPVRALIAQPLVAGEVDVGVLVVATTRRPGPGMLGAVAEVARYVSSQIELAELDASRARLDRAEVLALRAQISPHFIYNALNTIASFVRTDPDRARELVLDFADFTRYSFRASGEYTVLADELRNIDRYLTLERARFGNSLDVRLHVAPEVLNVVVPFLALQPLVENAVRHGLAPKGGGTITITAADEGTDCVITVEDDGVGMDPELLRSGAIDALDPGEGAHVGLTNVDHRLRAAFGNDYGLVVETAVGAGTKVGMRVPKFRAGIHA
ncbi:sensor histidine kinase [Gordonia paraffinivorans]|uniref:Two-component histidine kinase n=2 Tax=Gordonia paraffinivorans TaxID=175628 RepID=A0ABQ0IJF5_9ACTN|nr:histidine kinase [Gordonia paraffinivorans]MCD2145346.1 histidine kinase [Gordonia paraffinivorans]GAC83712.1 putative two-component histidine kinase [Gordonia paraffinivorans NBRC 108238]VFA89485.1 Inner membrane protein ypdA [Gordonia paraffinivorans]